MRVPMTEYLFIDLDTERWLCRICGHDLGDARGNYKEGTLVYDRDPREIHPPIIDTSSRSLRTLPSAASSSSTARSAVRRSKPNTFRPAILQP